jgi:hypothetical protein
MEAQEDTEKGADVSIIEESVALQMTHSEIFINGLRSFRNTVNVIGIKSSKKSIENASWFCFRVSSIGCRNIRLFLTRDESR